MEIMHIGKLFGHVRHCIARTRHPFHFSGLEGLKSKENLYFSHPYHTDVYTKCDTLSLTVIHCHAFWHRCIEPTVRLEHVTRSVFRVARPFDCF